MRQARDQGGASDAEVAAAALIRLVGVRVRELRKDAKMSRRELSERSGVSPRYLAQLEGGEGNISIGLLQRIAIALAIPVETLIAAENPPDDEAASIAGLYLRADARSRARVRELLDPQTHIRDKAGRICLIGLRGAGKSTLGALIARDFDLPFIELNNEIAKVAGMPVGEIIGLYGEEGYRQLEAETLESIISGHDRAVLAVGGGIVADGLVFEKVLRRFHTIWLKARPDEHMNRVRAQGDLRPMAGNPQAMAQLRQILAARAPHYSRAAYHLDTSGSTVAATHAALRDLLLRSEVAGLQGI